MIDYIVEHMGMEPWIGNYLLLPLTIFCARIMDVSMGTIRVIFVMQGLKKVAPFLGFLESLIWLLAVSQIVKHIDNPVSYIAFSGGFATGTFFGMIIEEKLALGKVLVRVITRREAKELIDYLKEKDQYFTNVPAEGRNGKVNVLFFVIQREKLPAMLDAINRFNPNAFYTIESVKSASETSIAETRRSFTLFKHLSIKRK